MIRTNPLPWAVVVSAYTGDKTRERFKDFTVDEESHHELGAQLRVISYPFKQVQGCYKGNHEHSYIVTLPSESHIAFIARLVFENFEQQSVLVLDPWRSAHLLFADGRKESLGRWHSVPSTVALARGAWTYDSETNTYWVCD